MRPSPRMLIATLATVAFCLHVSNAQAQTSPGEQIEAKNVFVQYINKVDIPATAEGQLLELRFEEGQTVNKDDVLAVIDDTAAQLALELKLAEEKEALFNASNTVNVRNAKNSKELAEAESQSFKKLHEQGALPYWEWQKKVFEAKRATLSIELAEMNQTIARIQRFGKVSERQIAEFELTRRKVKAPTTGFIERRIAQLGSWVQPGTPIATLIQMDRLRVEGDVDALLYPGHVRQGAEAQVVIYTSSDEEDSKTINGRLGFVSMEINSNDEYRVWVEIENQRTPAGDWLYKPGMQAKITIRKPTTL